MSPQLTHVFEKASGETKDIDIFVLESQLETQETDQSHFIIKKAPTLLEKGNRIGQLCSSRYFVNEDDPVERIVEELAILDNLFALGVVNKYGEALGVIIRRELFDLVGRSYGKSFIEGKTAQNVMRYVKSFSPGSSVFSVGHSVEEEMQDHLIHYFLIKDQYKRFCGVFSTKDMMLFFSRMVTNEMKLVQDIQRNIVEPELDLNHNSGNRIIGINQPAKEAGGDYMLVRELSDEYLFYAVADVSGKGYPASLITSAIGTLLENTTFSGGLSGSLQKLNSFLQKKFGHMGIFATGLFVMHHIPTGESEICDCGHQYFYILRDRKIRKVKSYTNPPLGLMEDLDLKSYRIKTQAKDRLVIMTDGVAEQENEAAEIYPLTRLASLVEKEKAQDFSEALRRDIQDFRGYAPQHDDITLLVHHIGE